MSTREATTADDPVIESLDQLVAPMIGGEKPPADWRIGTEHEKLVYKHSDHRAPSYEEKCGIRDLLKGLEQFGWTPVEEGGNVIALKGADGAVSLEPAGQLELSGAPLENLHQTCAETGRHLVQVKEVGEKCGVGYLGLGMWPDTTREELPIMPKGRYDIMLRHMPRVGSMGLDMMLRTCTIQVNLDYRSEADMVQKFRVGLALQPLATALFANSPFTEGKLNGLRSMRSEIWRDTDNNRSGMLAFAFEDGMGYERYVDWALDVPMYFVKRGAVYHDVTGGSFRALMDGKLASAPGERATLADWANHMGTLFPEVRLKRYLEMRGADAGPASMLVALPAFWVGLLYDEAALDQAWQLVKGWTEAERQALRDDVPAKGLGAMIGGRSVHDIARDVVKLARGGLARRGRLDPFGCDETRFLEPLDEIVASGKTVADRLIESYHGEWCGSVDPAFQAFKL
jgi:glutamate--cysteine ligase